MKTYHVGSLVIYHTKPAIVKNVSSDKIEISIEGRISKNVRTKDIEWLHSGPVAHFPVNVLNHPDIYEILELMEFEHFSFQDYTELLFGQNTPEAAYSAYLILKENLYFNGSIADGVCANPIDLIEQKLAEIHKKEQVQKEYDARVKRITDRIIIPDDLPYMAEIEQVANGLNSSSRLMKDAGIDCLPETAHRLLLDLKVWTYRNNPYPIRSGITLEEPQFPYQTYSDDDEREDLTYLNSYAIDNESSGDPDDAISYDNGILWVHIADPSPLVPLESDIDLEASHRGENLYLPEKIVHMLPVWISEQCCLGFKEVSPAISFGLKIDMETGDVFLERICLSKVKVQRHTYESVQQIEDRSDLQSIKDLLFRFKKFRADNGALFIDLPEVMIQVDESDKVHINRIAITPEREYVANAMIAAGYAVSKWAIENEIPMPFAVQAPPEQENISVSSIADMFALKKACTASSVSTIPGNHSGLGLNSYVRVTSPLRRYSDLLAHHQIRRFLKHSELLSADELEYVLSISENAASMRHKAERISNEYWTVVYLTQCPMDWSASAFAVYKLDNRFTFLIPEIAYEYKCRLGVEVALGDQRTLKLINADPVTLITKFQIIKNDETSEDEYSEKGAEE